MSFSAYLVGMFDRRFGSISHFQIVNPTKELLNLWVFFLDTNGTLVDRREEQLGANSLFEFNADRVRPDHGVVKIFSHENSEKLIPGIVGWQRRIIAGPSRPGGGIDFAGLAESNLAAIPENIGLDDFRGLISRRLDP